MPAPGLSRVLLAPAARRRRRLCARPTPAPSPCLPQMAVKVRGVAEAVVPPAIEKVAGKEKVRVGVNGFGRIGERARRGRGGRVERGAGACARLHVLCNQNAQCRAMLMLLLTSRTRRAAHRQLLHGPLAPPLRSPNPSTSHPPTLPHLQAAWSCARP